MNIFTINLAIGPSSGLRVAIKDTIDIAGYPTVAGSQARESAPAAEKNAVVTDRVLAAGCRIVGKTVLHELAFGVTGINDWAGTPLNPKYPHLIPGGSSSGSAAAVAAGVADFAIGTDTGGSIRIPAACCGVWGLKPTFGRVSREGIMPAQTSLDCVGPFAANIDMLTRAMEFLDPTFERKVAQNFTIGVVATDADASINAAIDAALRASGAPLKNVVLQHMTAAFEAGLVLINTETWAAVGDMVGGGLVGEDVATRLVAGSKTTQEQLAQAEAVRKLFADELDRVLEVVDVIALPTLPVPPPDLKTGRGNRSAVALTKFVRPFNLSGHPALSMPLSDTFTSPISLQLVGKRGEDEKLCAIAAALSRTWAGDRLR